MRERIACLDGYRPDQDKDFEPKNPRRKKKDVDPSLLQVVTIEQAGFIEPPNSRDQISATSTEFVLPKAPQPAASQ
jgi:hypothetical protein